MSAGMGAGVLFFDSLDAQETAADERALPRRVERSVAVLRADRAGGDTKT
jgi:hypothetical protein